ncbi:butyrophilin subfamily 2 member A1-like [Nothoprocta perdicaria]|uniref:butyrophilin subfamily 2 member A1-like n=1 Tax=Nothoprocta perdicaria TaxID=30464 RepID=UPI000E1B5E73|nr:butyrophilin subfamily 2 member A1-like [Nothoprocta perdicaria]
MGLLLQLTAVIFILVSTHHPTAGRGHSPLIVLDDYEGNGIRLKCSSERLFSEVHMLWTDSKGENFTGTPLNAGASNADASSSLLLQPESGNSVSCKIIDKTLKTSTESSVVIADVFFPATSPWLAAFVVILLLSILLVIAATYKLRKNNKTMARALNAKSELEKEISQLNERIVEEQIKSDKEIKEAENKVEKARNELEFRRARSRAVNITLDETCKTGNLVFKDKNRVKCCIQKDAHSKLVAVANEGFSKETHYWEVEVGDKPEWELGVLSEKVRDSLKKSNSDPLGFSLRFCQGKYILSDGKDLGISERCPVVGVALDLEEKTLSFYNVDEKGLLGSIRDDFSGKFYPFFNPGPDDKWLGIRPVTIPEPLPKAFT